MTLHAEQLTYACGDKVLLADVSLTLKPGILYGIIGPNGSGKSTLLKLLAGIWKPAAGRVLWQGEPLHLQERREVSRTISLVPQMAPLFFEFTVADLVAMGRYPHQTSWMAARDQQIIEQALRQVDGWALRHRLVSELSQGERQRVYIARSLATESPVLLLDEPTANLDIRHQLEIWKLLQELRDQQKIVAVAVHDLHASERFCEELIVLSGGRCVAHGPVSAVLTAPLLQEVFGVVDLMPNRTTAFELA